MGARAQTTLTLRTLRSEYQKAEQLLEPGADAAHSALGLCFANFAVPGGADAVDTALALKPRAIWLCAPVSACFHICLCPVITTQSQFCVCRSFGDFKPLSERVKASGIKLVCQVQTIEQAAAVVPLGADAVVAQVPQALLVNRISCHIICVS